MCIVSLVAADTRAASELHGAFAGAFSDYVAGPFRLTLDQWPSLQARQGIVDALSRVVVRGGEVIAFAFSCPRPETHRWRLGAMGSLAAARGTGAPPVLRDDLGGAAPERAGFERQPLGQVLMKRRL